MGQVLLLQLTHPLAPQMARLSMAFQNLVLRWNGHPAVKRPVAPQTERASQRSVRSAASGWGAKSHSWATS